MKKIFQKYKLGDLYIVSSGLSKAREEFGFGNPFVTFKDVFYNFFLPEKLGDLVNTTEKEIKSCSVKKGDIFLTRTSETLHELGMSCVSLKDYDKATFNGFTKRLRAKYDVGVEIDPVYIGYYLRSKAFRNQIDANASMTTRASLNSSAINSIEISIPDFDSQIKIGEILKSLDDKIELNLQTNKTLEEMANALYKHWFVDFQLSTTKLTKESFVFGKDLPIKIPIDYTKENIKNFIVRLKSESTYKKEQLELYGTIPVFDQSQDGVLGYHNNLFSIEASAESPIIIFGDHTCKLELITTPFSLGPNTIPFMAKDKELTYYLYFSILGTTKMNDYKRHWSELMLRDVILPTQDHIRKFNDVLRPLVELMEKYRNENQILKQTRDYLLPKLISGEVGVKDAAKTVKEVV